MKNAAAQTVGLQLVAALSCLILVPFFEWKMPSEPIVYFLLTLSCVFYAINNRLLADVRKNLEASAVSILSQSYTALITMAGFIFLKEPITWMKALGAALIIGGNALVFLGGKKAIERKYVWLGLLAYACNVAAGLIDVKSSGQFNLPFYTAFLYFVPALFIFISNRVKVLDVVEEFRHSNKRNYLITGICWSMRYLAILVAYTMKEVSVVAPLASLTVFSDLAVGYFFLKEKRSMGKKAVASVLAVMGIILVSL
ncbi:MAG: DMT family transporter [Candidatus Saccharibacteria bacterium]|nr:DMT family transporter [Candidatus Saccharibacteria bacterium]